MLQRLLSGAMIHLLNVPEPKVQIVVDVVNVLRAPP